MKREHIGKSPKGQPRVWDRHLSEITDLGPQPGPSTKKFRYFRDASDLSLTVGSTTLTYSALEMFTVVVPEGIDHERLSTDEVKVLWEKVERRAVRIGSPAGEPHLVEIHRVRGTSKTGIHIDGKPVPPFFFDMKSEGFPELSLVELPIERILEALGEQTLLAWL